MGRGLEREYSGVAIASSQDFEREKADACADVQNRHARPELKARIEIVVGQPGVAGDIVRAAGATGVPRT